MLKEAGFQVYRFGYEAIIQNLTQAGMEIKRNPTGKKILSMPDFVVIKDGYIELVEVKFRSNKPNNKSPKIKSLAKTWPETKILFVCKEEPYFRIANIIEFVDKNYLIPLEKFNRMKVDAKLIKKYSKQVIASYGV